MTLSVRNVALLGSTGSIGRSTLEVIAHFSDRLRIVGLAAHRNFALLVEQAQRWRPQWIVASDAATAAAFDWRSLPSETRLLLGPSAMEELAASVEVDIVVAAIIGSAGVRSSWAAIAAGKTVALANKETLVVAGPLVMQLAQQRGATILPVDSEHSAVFQTLQAGRREDVQRIVLTASGGPFHADGGRDLAGVTVAEALAHPTWNMGRKITIDSATMMNKALEIIEARWLFDLPAEQIDVVIHPQSIVHSLVEFRDGSLIGQLSPPDMKLPIQYALLYPERISGPAERLNLSRGLQLEFHPPDGQRFPALALGKEVARQGGSAGAVLNAANEAAVAAFLAGELKFTDIVPVCRTVLQHHHFEPQPSLDQLFSLDRWARQEVTRWVAICSHNR